MMNLHEQHTQLECAPEPLFELLNDVDYLAEHMPRTGQATDAQPWVRVDEDGCTLSWGAGPLHPGSLDVLPAHTGSVLVLRIDADADVADALSDVTDDIRRRAESDDIRRRAESSERLAA